MFLSLLLLSSLSVSCILGDTVPVRIAPVARNNDQNLGDPTQDPEKPNPTVPNLVSLLPSPNGPFYGFPFDAKTTHNSMLPFTAAGYCEPGKVYSIKKPEDILNFQYELECLYNAGISPVKVPEGPLYGTVISAINTRVFNQIVGQLWKGSVINRTTCHGNNAYVGWNNVMGNPTAPFGAIIDHHGLNLAPGEYDNGRPAVVLEYGIDLNQGCPEYKTYLIQTFGKAVFRGAVLSASTQPWNQLVNVFRFVGKQEDGGDIYLGKTYMKDAYRDDQQAATIAYFVLINYDSKANPVNIVGLPSLTVPSPQGFKYMHPGIIDLFFRMNPVDNFITTPVRTFNKLVRNIIRTGTNSFLFAQTLPFGLRNIRRNSQIFQHRFLSGLPTKQQVPQRQTQEQQLRTELEPSQPISINTNFPQKSQASATMKPPSTIENTSASTPKPSQVSKSTTV